MLDSVYLQSANVGRQAASSVKSQSQHQRWAWRHDCGDFPAFNLQGIRYTTRSEYDDSEEIYDLLEMDAKGDVDVWNSVKGKNRYLLLAEMFCGIQRHRWFGMEDWCKPYFV